MPNHYVNIVQRADGTSLIDISGTTAVPSDVAQGKVFFDASGAQQTGTASGGGTTWVTMFDKNVTIYSSSPNYIIVSPYSTPLAANETYRITWGNVTHEFETFPDPGSTSYDGYLVGNTGVVGGTDDGSGVALLLYHDRADRMVGVTTDGAGSKYLKIEKKIGGGGGGSDFIVNLTYDDQNDLWSPTCTFAEIQAAYSDGKAIATRAYDSESDNVFESKGFYDDSEEACYYNVIYPTVYQGGDMECERYHYYSMDSTGTVSDDGYDDMVLTSTLGPKTITANGTYDPLDETPFPLAGYNNVVVNVPSGAAKNVQTVQSTTRRNNTALGSIISLTCSTAGTYDVYWTCARSNTSQTWGSQLYINGTAYGTENTSWSNNVQNNHLTGVVLAKNDTVAVYGRSRSGYYIHAPQLTIEQTA